MNEIKMLIPFPVGTFDIEEGEEVHFGEDRLVKVESREVKI